MSLGAPWGLLALAAIAPLLAAYFLRRRQKPVKVSALFLWRTPDQRAEAGPRFERFSRELSLLLEILAVIAAALFLADLGFGADPQERHVVVVVDGGLSMSARASDGVTTAAERARKAVAEVVDDADRVTVVESGLQPRVLAGPAERTSRALSVLESWRPQGASHDPLPALVLAREIAGPGQKLFFFTDALPEDLERFPKEVSITATGAKRDNVAIVAAQRGDDGDLARVSVRVANYTDAERAVPVELIATDASGKPVEQRQQVIVPAGGSALLTLALRNVGDVRVRLPDDALIEDGQLTLLPSPPRKVNAALLTGIGAVSEAALKRFLAVAPGISLEGGDAGIAFGPRDSQAQVTFGAPGDQRTFVGPFFAERAHPLLEDVQLTGVVWTAGKNPPGHPLLSANDAVLLSEDEQGRIHFNIELGRSNLQRTPAWPVLMGNLLRRAREGLPGLSRRHLVLGEQVPVVVPAGARYALKGPRGERPILGTGALVLPAPDQPGRYELLRDGEVIEAVQVLPLDPRESDLRDRADGRREASAGGITLARASAYERSPWALLVLLALLLADFALTARGSRA